MEIIHIAYCENDTVRALCSAPDGELCSTIMSDVNCHKCMTIYAQSEADKKYDIIKGEVSKIDFKAGDILVFKYHNHMTQAQTAELEEMIKRLAEDIGIIKNYMILGPDVDLTVLSRENE
jgi:hypothetical protein